MILSILLLPRIISSYKEFKEYGYFKFEKTIYITVKNEKTGKKQNYKLSDNRKLHKTNYKFNVDNEIYELGGCYNNNNVINERCEYLSSEDENIINIIKEISHEEHAVYFPKIIKTKNNYYAIVPLNVNWQSPCKFYLYDKNINSLKLIHNFDGEKVVDIKD